MTRAIAEAEHSLRAGETQLAESRYREALFEAWILLGRLEEEAGELSRARRAYESASASTVEDRRANVALALVLVRLGETDQAELVLRTLVSEDTADFEARRLLSRALAEGGRLDEAVQELEQLRYLTPGDQENAYLLATAYLRQERLEEADELLAEIAAALPTPQTHILIGRTYRDADLHERARRAFETALQLDPGVRRAHYYLGTVHLLAKGATALADARRELEQELEVAPEDEMTRLFLGMALVEGRSFEDAIPHLELASRRGDLRADALRFLGRALQETGSTSEAIAALRQGLEAASASLAPSREPTEFEARQISSLHYQLAQALRSVGEDDEASTHFAEAKRYQARSAESARESLDRYLANETASTDLAPGASASAPLDRTQLLAHRDRLETTLARVYLNLGVLQVRENDHRRATELFEQAVQIDPDLPGLQYSLAVALFNSGEFERAAAPLSRALEESSGEGPLVEMLALSWLNSGEPARAAELLADEPARNSSPGLQYAYGLALVRSGRAAEASVIFQQLLSQNADWPELEVVLGQAFAQQGDFDSAIASLQRAIALDPEVAEAHSTLAEIHLRRGELAQAENALREELRLHPGDSRSAYTLATVLDLEQKPEEAMGVLRSLLAEQPDLAKGRYLLGKILLARGDAEAAREQLEAAAGLAPDDANTRYQLGQTYQKLGRTEDARTEFEAFRELKRARPDGEGS
ncbi:MAG TPA: tetratricopeptide repeat protein [Thermoanaerobaculia bacterium]|nr:tetratricopeptide repeat protein [Thermoanaerobaculia bacterium]